MVTKNLKALFLNTFGLTFRSSYLVVRDLKRLHYDVQISFRKQYDAQNLNKLSRSIMIMAVSVLANFVIEKSLIVTLEPQLKNQTSDQRPRYGLDFIAEALSQLKRRLEELRQNIDCISPDFFDNFSS